MHSLGEGGRISESPVKCSLSLKFLVPQPACGAAEAANIGEQVEVIERSPGTSASRPWTGLPSRGVPVGNRPEFRIDIRDKSLSEVILEHRSHLLHGLQETGRAQ